MWADVAVTALHTATVLADDGSATGGTPSGGGVNTNLIIGLATVGGTIVGSYLIYLSNRSKNRNERADNRQSDEKAGEINYRLGELEGHREDEQEARKVLDGRVHTLEDTSNDHEDRIAALEARRRPHRPQPPTPDEGAP